MQVWAADIIFHSLGSFASPVLGACTRARLGRVLLERVKVDRWGVCLEITLKKIILNATGGNKCEFLEHKAVEKCMHLLHLLHVTW